MLNGSQVVTIDMRTTRRTAMERQNGCDSRLHVIFPGSRFLLRKNTRESLPARNPATFDDDTPAFLPSRFTPRGANQLAHEKPPGGNPRSRRSRGVLGREGRQEAGRG